MDGYQGNRKQRLFLHTNVESKWKRKKGSSRNSYFSWNVCSIEGRPVIRKASGESVLPKPQGRGQASQPQTSITALEGSPSAPPWDKHQQWKCQQTRQKIMQCLQTLRVCNTKKPSSPTWTCSLGTSVEAGGLQCSSQLPRPLQVFHWNWHGTEL